MTHFCYIIASNSCKESKLDKLTSRDQRFECRPCKNYKHLTSCLCMCASLSVKPAQSLLLHLLLVCTASPVTLFLSDKISMCTFDAAPQQYLLLYYCERIRPAWFTGLRRRSGPLTSLSHSTTLHMLCFCLVASRRYIYSIITCLTQNIP